MVAGGRRGARPFAGDVFRWRAVPGGIDHATGLPVRKPPALSRAEQLHRLLKEYPGYTLRTLLEEDAHELLMLVNLLNPDLGTAAE